MMIKKSTLAASQASNWRPPGSQLGLESQPWPAFHRHKMKSGLNSTSISQVNNAGVPSSERKINQKLKKKSVAFSYQKILSCKIFLAFLVLFTTAYASEDLRPTHPDHDFGRRVISRQRLVDVAVQPSATLDQFKASRVRKRNFSVALPSERTLNIKDGKNENFLGPNQGKGEDERPSTPSPTTVASRGIIPHAKRISTVAKPSDWIPLLPTETALPNTPIIQNAARRVLSEVSSTPVKVVPIAQVSTGETVVSSVAESSISTVTARPEPEGSLLPFGSRTVTSTPRATERSTTTTTRRTEPTSESIPFGSKVQTKAPGSLATTRPVLNRPPIESEESEAIVLVEAESSEIEDIEIKKFTPVSTTTDSTTSTTTTSTRSSVTRSETTVTTTRSTNTEASSSSTTLPSVRVTSEGTTVAAPLRANSTRRISRVRLRDSLINRGQAALNPRVANSPRSFARRLEDIITSQDVDKGDEKSGEPVDLEQVRSSQVVSHTKLEDIAAKISEKRSSLVRNRTTPSKLLATTRRLPETTTTQPATTTTSTSEESPEENYTDRRVAELSRSGPEYQSTEMAESETEPIDELELEDSTVPELNTPVVERPAGLQKELLAAIRRKINKNRSGTITSPTTATTTTSTTSTTTSTTSTVTPISFQQVNSSAENNDIAGDPKQSTQRPTFFKPIPFPKSSDSGTPAESSTPRVQFFLRVPNGKPGSQVKIPDISHIQGKLARLNAAITEGLQEQRKQPDNNSSLPQEEAQPSTTTPSTLSLSTEVFEEEESVVEVLTSTSVSSIFSVVTGSGLVRGGFTTTTTSTTTTESTTMFYDTSSSPKPSSAPGRLVTSRPGRGLESSTKVVTESSSKDSSVSEIITVGKLDVKDIESQTSNPEVQVAQKTYTYLDRLRETRTRPPTTSPPQTSSQATRPTLGTKQLVYEIEPRPKDHPSSHFRPEPSSLPVGLRDKDRVEIVTPSIGDFRLASVVPDRKNETAQDSPTAVHDMAGTTVYVVGVICIIPAAGLVAWIVRYVMKKKDLSNSESGSETGLNCPASSPADEEAAIGGIGGTLRPTHGHDEVAASEPDGVIVPEPQETREGMFGSAWHVPRKNLRFMAVLGEGNFGKVWKAEAENICGFDGTVLVAVKTTKENAPEKEKTDLLQEMQIMQTIGHHPNVVTLLGVCVEKEPFLLVMEYIMYGKLLTHLREQRSRQVSLFQITDVDIQGETGDQSKISSKDLTKYAYGVAKGMEYIVSKGIIHRDLAARNILIDHNRSCKISDFGLSRNLSDTGSEMYEQKTKGALPIRWMAPESLYFSVFTPKSDVWSFGILMWEIVTLGSTPYPGMGAREVMRRVRDGYRLERPSHCHPELYKIISKCWAGDMNKRPDFTELRQELAKLLEDQHGYIDLQNIPENKYYSMTQNSNEEEKL